MSDVAEKLSKRPPGITIRRLFLCMFFFGCALSVLQLPWEKSYSSTGWMLLLLVTSLGAALGAPLGLWARGAIVGAGAVVVVILVIAIPFLAFLWGGP